jgi:predicted nucleic acid-binding protein
MRRLLLGLAGERARPARGSSTGAAEDPPARAELALPPVTRIEWLAALKRGRRPSARGRRREEMSFITDRPLVVAARARTARSASTRCNSLPERSRRITVTGVSAGVTSRRRTRAASTAGARAHAPVMTGEIPRRAHRRGRRRPQIVVCNRYAAIPRRAGRLIIAALADKTGRRSWRAAGPGGAGGGPSRGLRSAKAVTISTCSSLGAPSPSPSSARRPLRPHRCGAVAGRPCLPRPGPRAAGAARAPRGRPPRGRRRLGAPLLLLLDPVERRLLRLVCFRRGLRFWRR